MEFGGVGDGVGAARMFQYNEIWKWIGVLGHCTKVMDFRDSDEGGLREWRVGLAAWGI